MSIATALVWEKRDAPGASLAFSAYAAQLLLNVLWSALFFGMRRPDLTFVEIILLLAAIVLTAVLFWRIDPRAGREKRVRYLFHPFWCYFVLLLSLKEVCVEIRSGTSNLSPFGF